MSSRMALRRKLHSVGLSWGPWKIENELFQRHPPNAQMPSSNPLGNAPTKLIDRRRGTGKGWLMKFSSANPSGGKNLTFSSTNPFGGKKVAKIGHCSTNPSEDTRAVNQPFRLRRVSPRRATRKTRKRSYEHGKRIRRPIGVY